MSPLQWSLLILGAAIVVWLMYSAWREKKLSERPKSPVEDPQRPRFGQDYEPEPVAKEDKGFDSFGVSRPRKRGEGDAAAPASSAGKSPTVKAPPKPEPEPEAAPAAKPAEMLIAFYIAEHEGTAILGPKIHMALRARGLEFGAKKIYHRMSSGQVVFSVASLTKPGTIDPAIAEGFSTPGLSVFLQLPTAVPAMSAFQDMLDTAKSLASDLKAEVFDTQKQEMLTPEREMELHRQVMDFARKQNGM